MRSIFRNSGKKHLIVTGAKRIGKSTLIREAFPNTEHCIISTAVMSGKAHPEEIILNSCGMSATVGRYEIDHMEPVPAGFEIAIRAIDKFIEKKVPSVFIDEIGFLESSSAEYQTALVSLFDHVSVIASVRKQSTALIDTLKSREDVLVVDLDDWYGKDVKLGCVVLASGFATRFKSNKLLAELDGKPLISHLLEKLRNTDIIESVVVTRYPEVAQIADKMGFRNILHGEPTLSDTIRLGVGAMEDMDGYMLCVADQPYLSRDTLVSLLETFRYSPENIIRVKCGDTPGNPVIFPAKFREELLSLTGENGGRAVIKPHQECLRHLYIDDPRELFDIDTAEALNS